MQRTVTRNVRKLAVGQVVYTALCNETGGMIDDATVFRLGAGQLPVRRRRRVRRDLAARARRPRASSRCGSSPPPTSCTTSPCRGPLSREALAELIWTPPTQPSLEELKWFRFLDRPDRDPRRHPDHRLAHRLHRRARLRDLVPPVRRRGASGTRSGRPREPRGCKPLGLEALDILRIESGLIFAGYEFDDQVDPFEAGIGFTVALANEEDFVGREALLERQQAPAAEAGRARAGGQRDRRPRRRRLRRSPARRRRHERHAQPDAEAERSRCAGWRCSTRRSAPRSRSASSTGSRSGSRRRSCASRSMTRRRHGRGRETEREGVARLTRVAAPPRSSRDDAAAALAAGRDRTAAAHRSLTPADRESPS